MQFRSSEFSLRLERNKAEGNNSFSRSLPSNETKSTQSNIALTQSTLSSLSFAEMHKKNNRNSD